MLDNWKIIGCIYLGIGGVFFILGAIFFTYRYFTVLPEYAALTVAMHATSFYFLLSATTLTSGVVVLYFNVARKKTPCARKPL
jgi:Na+/phosphate symporter